MSKSKGVIALQVLILFLVISIVVVVLLGALSGTLQFAGIQQSFDLIVDNEDKGSGYVSFVKTNIQGIPYSEILGSMHAANAPEGMDSDLSQTLVSVDPPIRIFVAEEDWTIIKSYNVDEQDIRLYSISDIPLPGGRKGRAGFG